MGACSSVEVVDHDFPTLPKPLPPGLTAVLSTHPDTLSTHSQYASTPPSLPPAMGSSVTPSLLAALTAAANRASLSNSTTTSQHASNRTSTSVSKAGTQPTLRLASLTLDHDDDSTDTDTSSAVNSRRSTGEGKTEQAKVAPMTAAAIAYRSNVSPKHADDGEVRSSRGSTLLSGARQKRLAAEERERTAWPDNKGRMEEEKTQDEEGETKRASGRSRFSITKSKPQPPVTPLKSASLKHGIEILTPLTPPPVLVGHVSGERSGAGAAVDVKSGGGLKKSASVDGGLMLPAAPAIATQRVSSEVAILDVIRQLGQSQSVSVNTLSQYTRCVPAVLSGPLTRTPRGTGGASIGLPCCAKLQCVQCGMDVMMLDHHRWVADVRSDTFTSSYPEVSRLRSSLVAAVGSRAYCCACSWVDVKDQVVVDDNLCVGGGESETKERIRWACAGHQ